MDSIEYSADKTPEIKEEMNSLASFDFPYIFSSWNTVTSIWMKHYVTSKHVPGHAIQIKGLTDT